MAAPAAPDAALSLPRVFRADAAYRAGALLFCSVGVIGLGLSVSRHQTQNAVVILIPFLFFLAVTLLVWSYSLTADEAGLHQRSVLGRRDAEWASLDRLEQAQAYSVYDGPREPVWLWLLPAKAQEALAQEVLRRCALRPSGEKVEHPVKRRWVR